MTTEAKMNFFDTHFQIQLQDESFGDYLNQCCYCLDAPNYLPSGSTEDLKEQAFLILTGRDDSPMREPYGD